MDSQRIQLLVPGRQVTAEPDADIRHLVKIEPISSNQIQAASRGEPAQQTLVEGPGDSLVKLEYESGLVEWLRLDQLQAELGASRAGGPTPVPALLNRSGAASRGRGRLGAQGDARLRDQPGRQDCAGVRPIDRQRVGRQAEHGSVPPQAGWLFWRADHGRVAGRSANLPGVHSRHRVQHARQFPRLLGRSREEAAHRRMEGAPQDIWKPDSRVGASDVERQPRAEHSGSGPTCSRRRRRFT